jgi:hypothetical protein
VVDSSLSLTGLCPASAVNGFSSLERVRNEDICIQLRSPCRSCLLTFGIDVLRAQFSFRTFPRPTNRVQPPPRFHSTSARGHKPMGFLHSLVAGAYSFYRHVGTASMAG